MSKPDPKLFREMSEPHESVDALQADMESFSAGLAELRKKHKITHIVCVSRSNYIDKEGDESDSFSYQTLGDRSAAEAMLAFALGQCQKEREELIGKLLVGKVR